MFFPNLLGWVKMYLLPGVREFLDEGSQSISCFFDEHRCSCSAPNGDVSLITKHREVEHTNMVALRAMQYDVLLRVVGKDPKRNVEPSEDK